MTKRHNSLRVASSVLALIMSVGVFCTHPIKLTKVSASQSTSQTKEQEIAQMDGLQMWFDANDFVTETQNIERWQNKVNEPTLSGAGDAVQSAEANQPTFVAQSKINGNPAVRFSSGSLMLVGDESGFYLDDMTIIVVGKVDYDGNGTQEIMSRLSNSDFIHNWYFNCEAGKFNYGWTVNNPKTYVQARVSFDLERANVFVGRKLGSEGNTIVNGETLGVFANANPTAGNSSPVYLGGVGNSVPADYGEILIFNRGLSDAELESVNEYLYKKWGFESTDGALLDGITYNGELIRGFSSYDYEYDLILRGEVTADSFEATARYDGAIIEKQFTQKGVTFKVSNEKSEVLREYKINFRSVTNVEDRYQRAGVENVQLNSGFWKDTTTQYLAYSMDYIFDMYDFSESFTNFDRIAEGQRKIKNNTDEHAGLILIPSDSNRLVGSTDGTWAWGNEPWREGLIYEAMRAVSDWLVQFEGDAKYSEEMAELKARMEGYVDRIYAAALTTTGKDKNGKIIDGYFSTFTLLLYTAVLDESEGGHVWAHDLWNYGGLVEFAISWYEATGDTRMLFAATRFTEFLVDYMYGEDGLLVVPSHQLAEEPLLRLYDLYKNNPELVAEIEAQYDGVEGIDPTDRYYHLEIRYERYIDIVKDWIEKRGVFEGRYNNVAYGDYAQDHATYDKQTTAAGHSVRANLWYSAIAEVGDYLDNDDYLAAASTIWNNIVNSQMYITGGTGSVHGSESYGGDGHLPHDGYCETCASVGMAFFAGNMAEAFATSEYADVLELELYNGILGCMGMDGMSFYYQNPMTSSNYNRPFWSGATPCCPPMYMKFFANLASYIYMTNANSIIVDQYIASTANLKVNGAVVELTQATDLPNGNIATFELVANGEFALRLRMPSWAKSASITIDGEIVTVEVDADGYLTIDRTWEGVTVVEVTFAYEVERIYQDVPANKNQVAFRYGPFIYCAETEDNIVNGEDMLTKSITVPKTAQTSVEYDEQTFALSLGEKGTIARGVNFVKVDALVDGEPAVLTLIPFYLRTNRSMHNMDVFFWEEGTLKGGKVVYDFDGNDTGFEVISGFDHTDGKLKTNALGEYKAILKDYQDLENFRVEVEMEGLSNGMNGGVYLFAANASSAQDKIDAYNVQVERIAGANVFAVSIFEFSSSGGYLGNRATQSNIPWPADGKIKLSVVVYEGVIIASVNGVEYLRYGVTGSVKGGQVGLRSQMSALTFDNFALTCEAIPLDKRELTQKIEQAKEIDPDDYIEESQTLLADAITKAEATLQDAVCIDELQKACEKLDLALQSLVKITDLSELDLAMEKAQAIARESYTQKSLDLLDEAVEEGKLFGSESDQGEVDRVTEKILSAIDGLKLKADLSALNEVIARAEAIDYENFEMKGLVRMQIALDKALELTAESDQAEVDAIASELQEAIDELVVTTRYKSCQGSLSSSFGVCSVITLIGGAFMILKKKRR